jgi:hypothetical protein
VTQLWAADESALGVGLQICNDLHQAGTLAAHAFQESAAWSFGPDDDVLSYGADQTGLLAWASSCVSSILREKLPSSTSRGSLEAAQRGLGQRLKKEFVRLRNRQRRRSRSRHRTRLRIDRTSGCVLLGRQRFRMEEAALTMLEYYLKNAGRRVTHKQIQAAYRGELPDRLDRVFRKFPPEIKSLMQSNTHGRVLRLGDSSGTSERGLSRPS